MKTQPAYCLGTGIYFFREPLIEQGSTLRKVVDPAIKENLFCEMTKVCITAIITVHERQYKRYFETNISEQLRRETELCRLHNIDAEEIMGIFSSPKHATLCFLSPIMHARKNRIVPWAHQRERK